MEEKQAIGISEVVVTSQSWDQRFYWGVDNPKNLDDLKTLWKQKQSDIAGSLLARSDWRVIKARETGSSVPINWFNYRRDVRTACNTRQTEINNCADVAALKSLIDNPTTLWPEEP